MTWNPDPRFPSHVVEMAACCARGDDVRGPLADWFEENGMIETADFARDTSLGMVSNGRLTRSVLLGVIVGDGWANFPSDLECVYAELAQWLESRKL